MFNSLSALHDLVILGLCCPSLFFFPLCFFCVWFTMNQAMMSDCTITSCEIYVLWHCFRSVHCTVLYRVLGWIKDRGKGLTRSNKEHRASFFFGLREREFGNFGPRFAGVRNFLVSEICFHMWGSKLASLERGKSHS